MAVSIRGDKSRGQIRNLEKPINDLEAWLASKNAAEQNRWEVYYKNYQTEKVEQKSRNAQKTFKQGNSTREKNSAIAETTLNIVELDTIADYSEFLFAKEEMKTSVSAITYQ